MAKHGARLVDGKALTQLFSLLSEMLAGSDMNQQEMKRCQGLAVIGYLLSQISPVQKTLDVVTLLQDMLNKVPPGYASHRSCVRARACVSSGGQ